MTIFDTLVKTEYIDYMNGMLKISIILWERLNMIKLDHYLVQIPLQAHDGFRSRNSTTNLKYDSRLQIGPSGSGTRVPKQGSLLVQELIYCAWRLRRIDHGHWLYL